MRNRSVVGYRRSAVCMNMEQLSDEVILYIVSFLNLWDLMSISCVNRRLNKIAKDNSLFRIAVFHDCRKLSDDLVLKCIGKFRSSFMVVNFEECYWLLSTSIQRSLRTCRNLIQINLLGCHVTPKGLRDILLNNPMIVNISWSVPRSIRKDLGNLDRPIIEDLRNSFKKLKELTLRLENDEGGSISFLFTAEMALFQVTIYFLESKPFLSTTKIKSSRSFTLVSSSTQSPWVPHIKSTLSIAVSNALKTMEVEMLLTSIKIPDEVLLNKNVHLKKLEVAGSSYLMAKELSQLLYFNSSNTLSLSAQNLTHICWMNSDLKSLNLYGCQNCLGEDLIGLQSIANYCRNLRQLNMGKIHYHCRSDGNLLLRILARMISLESLTISDCMLATTSTDNLRKTGHTSSTVVFNSNRRISRLTETKAGHAGKTLCGVGFSGNQQTCSSPDDNEEGKAVTAKDLAMNYSPEDSQTTDVEWLTKCSAIKELEIIKSDNDCNWLLSNDELMVLSQWKKLRKLTISVAKNCSVLEFLSLNRIEQRFSSGFAFHLSNALPFLHNLQVLRLEQPRFNITRPFLSSMYECKRLHSLCVIASGGRIQDGVDFSELFNMCQNLSVMFVSCESPAVRLKRIQKCLVERFRPQRPALSVTMLSNNLQCSEQYSEALERVPYCIKNDLVYFKSRVASSELA